jgi:antitoxin (DNA-binding transcriptional repressor) of toxin-antitoxin stability system
MTATVEQIQRDLSGLIRLAAGGEEIVMTQGGRPVAKLTGIITANSAVEREGWLQSLRLLRQQTATSIKGRSSDEVLNDDRTGRD